MRGSNSSWKKFFRKFAFRRGRKKERECVSDVMELREEWSETQISQKFGKVDILEECLSFNLPNRLINGIICVESISLKSSPFSTSLPSFRTVSTSRCMRDLSGGFT